MLELLSVFQIAALALKVARDQVPALQAHKERCELLIDRTQQLLDEVTALAQTDKVSLVEARLSVLESSCSSVRDTVTELAGKGLAWRLLHQEQMERALIAAESKLTDAFYTFQVGAHVSLGEVQADIAEASKRDTQQLITYLDAISQNDQRIIDALRANNLRLEETLTALMKHLQSRPSAGTNDPPSEAFMRRAVDALKKVSGRILESNIAPWQITRLEVEYSTDDEDCLGIGGFGKVFKGHWHGEIVAVKEMHEALLVDNVTDRRTSMRAFEKEIKIWLRLTHPRIVPFYGACLEAEKPFLVTKYCPNGNVMDFIREFPEVNRLLILHQVSVGMKYLHSQNIIHSDLKAANILIGDDDKALICDFGLSQLQGQTVSSHSNFRVIQGTLNYMAPEYLDGDPIDYPADVYSFGMTSWQIHTGLVPFSDVPRRTFHRLVVDKQERPQYPNSMNVDLWKIIQDCWQHESFRRPSFTEVEASLKPLVEPYMDNRRRLSISTAQMLMIHQMPTPPQSEAASEQASATSPRSVAHPPSIFSPLPPSTNAHGSSDWVTLPPTPISYPISPNSIEAFNSTLHCLDEIQSLDNLIHSTLLCYKNWLKDYKAFSPRMQHPPHVFKNRVKDAIKEFKRALLIWVDNIPSLRGADILNRYRTLLLITGTCCMAEHTARQSPEAPHRYVQQFIDNMMATSAFRAAVEGSVKKAWNHYRISRDKALLAERLAHVVNQVASLNGDTIEL